MERGDRFKGQTYESEHIQWRKSPNPYVAKSNMGHMVTFSTIEARDRFLSNWRKKMLDKREEASAE